MTPAVLGWYVRVTTTEEVFGELDTKVYVVGYLDRDKAEAVVRVHRNISGELYDAVEEAVVGYGIQVANQEVRFIPGAK